MRENGKVYSFVIALPEYIKTVPTLWNHTRDFVRAHPEYLAPGNSLSFLTFDERSSLDGEWNRCHFWSNFEIASLEFWRGKAYSAYFEHLDRVGGFYYERWGDAPVHSLAAALFLPTEKVHHFADVGYRHRPWERCPVDEESHVSGRCLCDRERSYDTHRWSCLPRWWKIAGKGEGA